MEEKIFEAHSRLIKTAHDFATLTLLQDTDSNELAWLVQFDAMGEALERVSALRRGDGHSTAS